MDGVEYAELLNRIEGLSIQINDMHVDMRRGATKPTLDLLYGALAKAKLAYKPLRFSRENSFNRQVYADLSAIQRATDKALSEHELVFIQEPRDEDGTTFLYSRLGHSSGQDIICKNRPIIPPSNLAKSDNQRFGESLAYLKRQVAQAMLGIVADNDPEDNDDADNSNMIYTKEMIRSVANDPKPAHLDQGIMTEKITKDQLNDLYIELDNYPITAASILRIYEIKTLADLPKAKYLNLIQEIRHRKDMLKNSPTKEW